MTETRVADRRSRRGVPRGSRGLRRLSTARGGDDNGVARTRVPEGGSSSTGGCCTTPTVMVPPGWPRTCLAASFAAFFAASASFLAFFSASRLSCFSVFSTGAPSAGAGSVAGASDDIVRRVGTGRGRRARGSAVGWMPIDPNTPPTRKTENGSRAGLKCRQ